MNREKIIKGLECCSDALSKCGKNCPYWDIENCQSSMQVDTLALLKAQESEAMDIPKPDSDIGCWYDITHNYTLEQVVNALKSRELCEDAVSRKYLLDQSYSIKFQTIDKSDEEVYREEVVCVEDIKDAPSVQPISVARIMTPIEAYTADFVYIEFDGVITPAIRTTNERDGHRESYFATQQLGGDWMRWDDYGIIWRCWTSRPTDEQREETPWNAQK